MGRKFEERFLLPVGRKSFRSYPYNRFHKHSLPHFRPGIFQFPPGIGNDADGTGDVPKEGCKKRLPVPTGIESWSGNRLFRKKGAEPPLTTLFMAGAKQWRGRFFGASGVERGAANRMGAAVFGGERAQKGRSDRAIYGQGGEFSWRFWACRF